MNFYEEVIAKETRDREKFKTSKLRSHNLYSSKKKPTKEDRYTATVGKSGPNFTSSVMRQELRDNRGLANLRKDMLGKGFLLLDSSYTQAANPNSMRDFGPARNVVYNIDAYSQREDEAPSGRSSQYSGVHKSANKMLRSKFL